MRKLHSDEISVFKRIIWIVFVVSMSWVGFYELMSFFDVSKSHKYRVIILFLFGSIVFAYVEAKRMSQNISDKNQEMVALYSQLVASDETLRSQYDELFESRNLIRESEQRYRSLFELSSEGLFDMDADYKMTYYSVDWYKLMGVDTSNPDITEWTKRIIKEDSQSFDSNMEKHFTNGDDLYVSEYRIVDDKNEIHWISALGKAIFNKDKSFKSMSGVHRDITAFKKQEAAILNMAYKDRLTGLPNRLKFEDMVNSVIEQMEAFGILYIDIDSFKYINDTYGHQFGDEVIKAMAERLQNIIHPSDIVSRLSGDAFGVICKTHVNKEDLEQYTKYILDQLSVPYEINKLNLVFTASIGATLYPEDGEVFKDLLVNLDIAIDEAKDTTKNSYKFYNKEMRDLALEKANLENHLVRSLELDEIYLMYQPVMNLSTMEVDGFEALVRWIDTEFGQVFPDIFIPIAEKSGYIHQLGDYVLEEAITFAKHLFDKYKRFFMMNVNVSPLQLHEPGFVDRLHQLLVKYHYPAQQLNLEITESVALDSDKTVIKRLAEIRKMGVSISLDDFGTGYSSLNNLVNLSVSHIKIDKSLVQQATTIKEVHQLIRGVVEFAHALELKVVAEGVETVKMEEIIASMQIDLTQGYYYAKPLIKDDVIIFIEENLKKEPQS